ncbi:hypothetical protein PS15m_011575 [Mucor circinelloides]
MKLKDNPTLAEIITSCTNTDNSRHSSRVDGNAPKVKVFGKLLEMHRNFELANTIIESKQIKNKQSQKTTCDGF